MHISRRNRSAKNPMTTRALEPRLRPLPFNGGYFPVVEVAQAVSKTGFRGWFSYKVFNGESDGKGINADMLSYAETATNCQKKLLMECAQAR